MSVFETFFILNVFYCVFLAFCFQVLQFLLGLTILNLSFVANFEVAECECF